MHAQADAMEESARQQAEAISGLGEKIVGELGEGLQDIASELAGLDASVGRLSRMIDWRLSEVIDQQRINNVLLGDIASLLRIPDVQKERQYHITQGFKHYKNAAIDGDLCRDALENFLEAESREKTDYIVLHRIGMIYLYSPALLNLEMAESYFRKAGKYAVVESDPGAYRIASILSGDENETGNADSIKNLASDSYFQAGVACFAQRKYGDAQELSRKAYDLNPQLYEAGYLIAKVLMFGNDETQAANIIERIIQSERFYSVKVAADGDFAPSSVIANLLQRMREEAFARASDLLQHCRSTSLPNSMIRPLLSHCETLLGRNAYLDSLSVLDKLTCRSIWAFPFITKLETHFEYKYLDVDGFESYVKLSRNCRYVIDSSGLKESGGQRIVGIHDLDTYIVNTITLPKTTGRLREALISGDGEILLLDFNSAGSANRHFDFYSVKTSDVISIWSGGVEMVHPLLLSHSGDYLAVNDHRTSGFVSLWNIRTRSIIFEYPYRRDDGGWGLVASFSPDDSHFVFGDIMQTLVNINDGRVVSRFRCERITSVAFSPDNKVLATVSCEKPGTGTLDLKFWYVDSGKCFHESQIIGQYDNGSGHNCKIIFNRNGTLLFLLMSVSDQNRGRFVNLQRFDVETYQMLDPLYHDELKGDIANVCISERGDRIGLVCRNEDQDGHFTKVIFWNAFVERNVQEVISIEHEFYHHQNPTAVDLVAKFNEQKRQRVAKARRLHSEAIAEFEKQRSKWIGKNFSNALNLFTKASALGSADSVEYIKRINAEMS